MKEDVASTELKAAVSDRVSDVMWFELVGQQI
jgi:hypothetical protein